jgi:hypothetical protein
MQPTFRQVPPSVPRHLDAGHLHPELAGSDRGVVAARSPSDDDDVVLIGHAARPALMRRGT